MSYILDALRKAERSRQQHHDPKQQVLLASMNHEQPSITIWRHGGVFAALLANGLLLGVLILNQTGLIAWLPHGTGTGHDAAASAAPLNPLQEQTGSRLVLADEPLAVNQPVTLSQLPSGLRQRFAGLNLDLHVYGERSEQRFVLINSQRYRAGDWLAEGPLLEAIVPEGVILSYGDSRFRLSP